MRTNDRKVFRRSLKTDSLKEATLLVANIVTQLNGVKLTYSILEAVVKHVLEEKCKKATDALLTRLKKDPKPYTLNEKPVVEKVEQPTPTTPTYQDALKQLIADKSSPLYVNKKSKPINSKTREEILKWLDGYFYELLKDKHIEEINHRVLDSVFYLLTCYPVTRLNPYKTMTEEQRIKLARKQSVPEEDRQRSGMTRARTAISKLFEYFYSRNLLESNPVDKMRFKGYREDLKRGAFNNDQIRKLTKHCAREKLNHYTASVLIMAYSGLRNGEIVKLTKDSIRKEGEFYYFDVRGTKTENAERYVPIHPALIEYGILEYFNTKRDSITSQSLTQWFNRLSDKLGLPKFDDRGAILSFYSLRHSFATALANGGISELHIESLMGHRHQGTKHVYIDKLNLEKLYNSICNISF